MILPALFAVFAPLCGGALTGALNQRISPHVAYLLTISFMCASFGGALLVVYETCLQGNSFYTPLFTFLQVGELNVSWSLYLDALSGLMMGIITFVSLMVHVYSIGYMKGEEGTPRFMCYLSLFTFFMLVLVTSANLLQLFVGWEGVGLASYLLIGFYYKKPSAGEASLKAFLVNRVGDAGFIIGLCLAFVFCHSLQFSDILPRASEMASFYVQVPFWGVVPFSELLALAFFVGAMGKSAQLGLHVWLPDAMEGPTPVSALIHAATMVTAGIFLMVRLGPVLEYAPMVQTFIVWLGGLTCFVAATIGCVQTDIKRVIAYSTCSQLGYMFMAVGCSAYGAAMFHLTTHAFFKALLFLSAGSTIHAFSGTQEMGEMGGVWRTIPFTYAMIWIGSLALAGLPFFAGFYSKDAILAYLWGSGVQSSGFGLTLGLVVVLLTAFYSWRLIFLVFHGSVRASSMVVAHIHESPWVMRAPLVFLAFGAVFAGKLGFEAFLGPNHMWGSALVQYQHVPHLPFVFECLPILLSLSGIGIAYALYMAWPALASRLESTFKILHTWCLNKWYFDVVYDILFRRTLLKLSSFCWLILDKKLIDGCGVHGVTRFVSWLSTRSVLMQTGCIQHYALLMLLGLIVVLTVLVHLYV